MEQKKKPWWVDACKESPVSLMGVRVQGGEIFPVIKTLLVSQSPMFKAMVESKFKEGSLSSSPTIVDFPELDRDVFAKFMMLIYTETFPEELESKNTKVWLQVMAFCDQCLFEKGKIIIQATFAKLFLEKNGFEIMSDIFAQRHLVPTIWEDARAHARNQIGAWYHGEGKDVPIALIGCADYMTSATGIRVPEEAVPGCCLHSLVTEEEKIRLVQQECFGESVSPIGCLSSSLTEGRIISSEAIPDEMETKFCCAHARGQDSGFREYIKETNQKKIDILLARKQSFLALPALIHQTLLLDFVGLK